MESYLPLLESIKRLVEGFKETETDPWMLHVPLPRVVDLMAQSIPQSLASYTNEEQNSLLVPLCLASSDSTFHTSKLLSQFPKESSIWDAFIKAGENVSLPHNVLVLTYTYRSSYFEKHLIECLHIIAQKSILDLSTLKDTLRSDNAIIEQFLGHNCDIGFEVQLSAKYRLFLDIITTNSNFFNLTFSLLGTLLTQSNYSIVSVQTVKLLSNLLSKRKTASEFYPPELMELAILLSEPPCVHCNDWLSSHLDLSTLTDKIDSCLQESSKIDTMKLQTILCMNCEWLIHCKTRVTYKTLFLNNKLLF